MATFGETLKRERELRKITLREVSEATKIGLRYLEALEGDRFDQLPGGLFNKGFIRAYAKFIGLDGEAMVNAYLYDLKSQEKPQPPRPRYAGFSLEENGLAVPPAEKKPVLTSKHWVLVGVVGAALLVLALALWLLSLKGPAEPPRKTASPPPAADQARIAAEGTSPAAAGKTGPADASATAPGGEPGSSTAESGGSGPEATREGGPPATSGGGPQETPAAASPTPRESGPKPPAATGDSASREPAGSMPPSLPGGAAPSPRPSQAALQGAPTGPLPAGREGAPRSPAEPAGTPGATVEALSLALTASETTWIAVSCDGVVRLNKEILAGDTVRLSCRGKIRLSCGNAGTVTIRIDGNDCLPLGERGEVIRDFIFDRARAAELCPAPSQEP